jgi:hypothetical protein
VDLNSNNLKLYNIPVLKSIRRNGVFAPDNISSFDPLPLPIGRKGIESLANIHLQTLEDFVNISLNYRCNSITINTDTFFLQDKDEVLIVDKKKTVYAGVCFLRDYKNIILTHRHKNVELSIPLEDIRYLAKIEGSAINPYI